jgi:hypothetical protein
LTKLYFVNTRTGRRYEVIKIENDEATLKGEYREFTVPKVDYKKLGYTLERIESE